MTAILSIGILGLKMGLFRILKYVQMSLNVIISLFQATLDDMEDNLLVGSNNFTQPREFDLLQVEKNHYNFEAVFIFNFGCYNCKIILYHLERL